MSLQGYTGLSFPFRISSQGGSVLTTTSKNDTSHIDDSIAQIIGTYDLERPMESDISSGIDVALFEPNDEGIQAILRNLIAEALEKLEDRISVSESDIEFETEQDGESTIVYVIITYTVLKYNTTSTNKFFLGEV